MVYFISTFMFHSIFSIFFFIFPFSFLRQRIHVNKCWLESFVSESCYEGKWNAPYNNVNIHLNQASVDQDSRSAWACEYSMMLQPWWPSLQQRCLNRPPCPFIFLIPTCRRPPPVGTVMSILWGDTLLRNGTNGQPKQMVGMCCLAPFQLKFG